VKRWDYRERFPVKLPDLTFTFDQPFYCLFLFHVVFPHLFSDFPRSPDSIMVRAWSKVNV